MTDQKAETELKTLYQITGNAADINTILINRGEFRYLRARVAELEAQLESVGVGGVGPLMPVTMQHQHNPCNINHLQGNTGDLVTSSSSVPAGWKLVPVEPTIRQMAAMGPAIRACYDMDGVSGNVVDVYRAMLAAAPQPPLAEQPQPVEMLGETCIDGGKCHHKCTELCFRRKCCAPFSDYSGPWNYDQPQPQIDWKDLYQKEKRRAEMWIAKYEKDIGKLEVAVPVAARPPSVAARTCANCLHNKPPFGNCDGCSQQNDDADDEGNWEPIPEPQGEQEPAYLLRDLAADIGVNAMDLIAAIRDAGLGSYSINMMLPTRVCVAMCQKFAVAPQHEPLKEHEIEAALSRVNRCALTPKGIRIAEARAIEYAHNIRSKA